jgi:hypothetical protein
VEHCEGFRGEEDGLEEAGIVPDLSRVALSDVKFRNELHAEVYER